MVEWTGLENQRSVKATVGSNPTLSAKAKVAQLVEHDLAKVGVAGSNPVFRSIAVRCTSSWILQKESSLAILLFLCILLNKGEFFDINN